jgi:hypothetical protein
MMYATAVMMGIVAAILAVVLWIGLTLGASFWWLDSSAGSGGAGFIVMGQEIVLVAVVGFAVGCWWSVRRQRRRTAAR